MDRGLNAEFIVQTIVQLRDRVEERFPGSGLSKVAAELHSIGTQAVGRAAGIAKPNLPLRLSMFILVVLLLGIMVATILQINMAGRPQTWAEFIQGFDSALNAIVLIGGAILFLFTVESRLKRHRALQAIHELRSLAHIIDMHQLTKDPDRVAQAGPSTKSSPKRVMTSFELSRYLDYCSEMLSLIGKIAALYVQGFNDPVVLSGVDQIEDLTTSLSRKIWQKIMIIHGNEKDSDEPAARG
jgi:hypothetical protein